MTMYTYEMVHMTFLDDGIPGISIWKEEHEPVENWLMNQRQFIDEFML